VSARENGDSAVPPGVDPTVFLLVRQNAAASASASAERREQSAAFVGALDKLGGRFEAKMDAQTGAMVSAARLAAGIVVLTLLILGSVAGAVTYLKGGGFEAGSAAAAPVAGP
jgi:hypothetical protein